MTDYKDWKILRRISYLLILLLSFFVIFKTVYSAEDRRSIEIAVRYMVLLISSSILLTLSFQESDKIFPFEVSFFIYSTKTVFFDLFIRIFVYEDRNTAKTAYYFTVLFLLITLLFYLLKEIRNFNINYMKRNSVIFISVFLAGVVFFQIIFNIYILNILNFKDIPASPYFFFKLAFNDLLFVPLTVFSAIKCERNNKYALIAAAVILFDLLSGIFISSTSIYYKLLQSNVSLQNMDVAVLSNEAVILDILKTAGSVFSGLVLYVYVKSVEISHIKVFK